ncbi:Teichuronic acid biosynthesis protein TuaB [Klebsiella huaxiensis]|uniref:lipopolysaccharide biosynthesis protein n=1 Tax=Klebsiella huaxiensis TaxID=2153354 RepID=UPI0011592B0C|nr:lipopolysaccharide biosynthesis protein [Klebsiella huaxiensis]VUS83948.1 Teichuronic acid biosynthesis protein TuaB [Klebsiella huaxiensis]
MSGIKGQAVWLLGANLFSAILQIVQISILARTLELHELGVLAMVNTVLALAMVLQDMGMSSYIVYKQDITRSQQSTIYWINLFLSVLTGVIVFFVSFPVSNFYDMPKLEPLIMLASINFLFLGSLSQYQAHYIKAKKMVLLSQIEMTAKFLSFIFVVWAIYNTGLRTSAVIIGLILNAMLRLVFMSWLGEKEWRPLFVFDKKIVRDVFKYGIYQLGSQIINQLRTQLDVIIVGKILGGESLGLYSLAKDLVLQPLKLITPVINRLALPRFAEVQNNKAKLSKAFLNGTFIIATLSSVAFIFIYLFSPIIVSLLYGKQRLMIVDILPFMLLFGTLRPMGGLTGAIAQANGKTNIEFYWNVVAGIAVLIVTSSIFFYSSLWFVSLILSISQVLITFLVFPFFIRPIVHIEFMAYIKRWTPITVVFCILIFLMYKFNIYIDPFW